MNWIDSHNRVEEGVTGGSCSINRLLFIDDLVLLKHLLHRVFSMHSIDFLLHTTEPEWKLAPKRARFYVSLETQGSVCYKWAAIDCNKWRRSSILDWYLRVTEGGAEVDTRIGKANAILRELYRSAVNRRELSNTAKLKVLNRSLFRSLPMVKNFGLWLKKYYLKCKRHKKDFCQESTVWRFATKCAAVKFAEPWMSNHFSSESRDASFVSSAICPECLTKSGEASSSG